MPTLVTHGAIVNSKDPNNPKVMTGTEHLVAVGEMLGGVSEEFECQIDVEDLPVPEQKKLAGNSYDATTFSFFTQYCLSNCTRRSQSGDVYSTEEWNFDLGSSTAASSSGVHAERQACIVIDD